MRTNLAEKRAAYAAHLAESLTRIVETLSAMPVVERIVLFGSYAQGRRDLFTDLDILVVMRTDLGFLERTTRLYQMLDLTVDADILCYTPEEFDQLKDRPFFRRILREEVLLYEKKPA